MSDTLTPTTPRRCEWCDRPSPWAVCVVCRGAPEPRETFANFLPVELAITTPPRRAPPVHSKRPPTPCKLCADPARIGGWCRKHSRRCRVLGLPYSVAPEVLAAAIEEADARTVARARELVKGAQAVRMARKADRG